MEGLKGDEIVISGISGTFPDTIGVQELSEKLFNKIDMITKPEKLQHIKNAEYPKYHGVVKDMDRFDAHFFRVTPKQATSMDPVTGKLMEHAMSALFDAGVNPETLKGSKMGVYVACCQVDSANFFYEDISNNPFVITGNNKCMLANRISYWIDSKGPSYGFDNGHAGSMSALEMACNAMKRGEIECALVGASNYCYKKTLSLNLKRAGLLCLDGKTKCFDKNGDGYVRSDAINVIFLQKAKHAKRIYSEVYHVKGKYFASPDNLFSVQRKSEDIKDFLEEFYSEIDVSPKDVEFIEANSFGIATADGNELEAIGAVFSDNKTVKVGSVKSNLGNTEGVSGNCSVTKLCLAYQKGKIPANLHYEEPQDNLEVIKMNKVEVLTESEPFDRTFTAINNYCFTGMNYHALLKGHFKPKANKTCDNPRLVLVSSRQDKGVNHMLDHLETKPIDPEELALLNNIFKINIPGYTGRGYTVLDTDDDNKTICLSRGFEYYTGTTRPVWFLYSGMGSQWSGMGEDLMRIPVFAAAIQRCDKVLVTKGLDIVDIITSKKEDTLNILTSLVAITAIQIGLTDVMKSIGLTPDNVIGHSLGEICCAYADGSLTTEQAILTAYYRAIVSYETKFEKGTMAAIGLGYKEVKKLCPSEIVVACHNSPDSATISGPSDIVSVFVKSLTDLGIFAKEVASYDIAFHSPYIAEAGPKMLNHLKTLITNPKKRTDKWFSTCYLPEDWDKTESQYATPEYFTHNLMNSVLFEETAALIPKEAIIIEIAPHGLLQAIMKRSHKECVNVSLTKRGENGANMLMKAIGNLYLNGINFDLESMYPKIEFPVSTETPSLSHLVKWDHDTRWTFTGSVDEHFTPSVMYKEFTFSVHDDEFAFIRNNLRNGRMVLTEAAILVFVWDTLAEYAEKDYKDISVIFNNVKFLRQISLEKDEIVKLNVTIQKGCRKFEILCKNEVIADGQIDIIKKNTKLFNKLYATEQDKPLSPSDIYTMLRIKGHSYYEEYQYITSMNVKRNKATIRWVDHWIGFLDSIILLNSLANDYEQVCSVKLISKLTIDVDQHKYKSFIADGMECYGAFISKDTGVTECGGVIFEDIIFEENPTSAIEPKINKEIRIKVENKQQVLNNGRRNEIQRMKLLAKESNMESMAWTESVLNNRKPTSIVQICYSGISTKDIKNLTSLNNQGYGMDFSGLDQTGRKVMGIVPSGALATKVESDPDLLWSVPQHWSLAEAATVPLPYIHAFYCLAIRHVLREKQTIMIIGASGALGQAVISIALHMKCTVFGTVSNLAKKRMLLRLFPELNEQNIGFTYDDSFHTMVVERTKNRLCNVVINTACGKTREVAMKCIGNLGQFFLDVNDTDQSNNEEFKMSFLQADRSYKSVNMSSIFLPGHRKYKQALHQMLVDGISQGYVRPLTSVVYSPSEVPRAFKLISNRANVGRAIINVKELDTEIEDLNRMQRIVLYPNKAYIVLCDGSELGVELVNLLIQRGARRLLLNCNPTTINGYFFLRYNYWKKQDITIEINSDDLRIEDKCKKLFENAVNLGFVDVDGVFVAWSHLRQKNKMTNQNLEDTCEIVTCLDKISRNFKNMSYFSIITATHKDFEEKSLKKLENICVRRSEKGFSSLFLSHVMENKVWTSHSLNILFRGLEASIQNHYTSVGTSSVESELALIQETPKTDYDAGFRAFLKNNLYGIDLQTVEPVVPMETKLSSYYDDLETDLYADPDVDYMVMIPGLDGNYKTLCAVAERLKKPALALQPEHKTYDSVPEIAKDLLKYVKVRCNLKSPFLLMGYSFGVNVALEMAALLEKEGLLGTVYCIDSSPEALRSHLDAYIGSTTEEQLQDKLIEYFYKLFTNQESALNTESGSTWEQKVHTLVNAAKKHSSYNHEYMRGLVQSAFNRISLAKSHKPEFVLKSEVVLLKGVPHPKSSPLSQDYDLSLYTEKPVHVFDVKSDHAMVLQDPRVTNFVNRTLN